MNTNLFAMYCEAYQETYNPIFLEKLKQLFKTKHWHITRAEYVQSENLISEKKVSDFEDFEVAKKWFYDHADQPIYLWHDGSQENNPYFPIMETDAYIFEFYKIKEDKMMERTLPMNAEEVKTHLMSPPIDEFTPDCSHCPGCLNYPDYSLCIYISNKLEEIK